MKTIYIVEGQTGQYSDFRYWPVKAFQDEQKAKDFAKTLNDKARDLGVSECNIRYNEAVPHMKELDPNVSIDYTGVWYCMYELGME